MNSRSRVLGWLWCLILTLSSHAWSVEGGGRDARIFVETGRKLTKGFPVILRVTAFGPQKVPKLSLFDETAMINVMFTSRTDGKVYTIRSGTGTEILLATPEGIQIDSDSASKAMFEATLSPGESRAMLLDLGSLRPITKGIILDNIPPGSYRLSVEFPSSGVVSNAVDVDILKPSDAERVYLKGIQSLGPISRGDGVNWSKVLRDRMAVPENSPQIRSEAQDQLRFHTLLSKIVRSEIRSSAQTKTTKVPDYLKEEKDCLLLELDENSGKKPSTEEKKAFKDKNPGFEWRFRDSQKERADFLLYRVDNKKS